MEYQRISWVPKGGQLNTGLGNRFVTKHGCTIIDRCSEGAVDFRAATGGQEVEVTEAG